MVTLKRVSRRNTTERGSPGRPSIPSDRRGWPSVHPRHGCEDPLADSPFPLARAVTIWLTLIAVESIHGVARRLLLEPHVGDLPARQVSIFTGAMLIILVFWFTLKLVGPQPGWRWWEMGLLWLTLTLAFEIGLGRAAGMSWDRIASDFDPRRGGFLALGMAVILVAPRVLAARLGLIQEVSGLADVRHQP